jgi:hypothetical protein
MTSEELLGVVLAAMDQQGVWVNGRMVFEPDLPVLTPQDWPSDPDDGKIKIGSRVFTSPYVIDLCRSFWADPELWQIIARRSSGRLIARYVKKTYGLVVPSMPRKIWQALASNEAVRGSFFDKLALQTWRILSPTPELYSAKVRGELERKHLEKLLRKYLTNSGLDHKALMASQLFSETALSAIKDIAGRMIEDADWCLKNKNKIPPTVVRNRVGSRWVPEHAAIIEDLVQMLKESPQDSNGQIAKSYCERTKYKGSDTIRIFAAIARKLAWHRDGIKVKFHKRK